MLFSRCHYSWLFRLVLRSGVTGTSTAATIASLPFLRRCLLREKLTERESYALLAPCERYKPESAMRSQLHAQARQTTRHWTNKLYGCPGSDLRRRDDTAIQTMVSEAMHLPPQQRMEAVRDGPLIFLPQSPKDHYDGKCRRHQHCPRTRPFNGKTEFLTTLGR